MTATTTILIAGGGSGGHIFPGLAVAERIAELAPDARAAFVCSDRAVDRRILENAAATFHVIPARPWSLRPGRLVRFLSGTLACRRALRPLFDAGVTHVLAMGGFVAAPVVSAALRRGVPATLVNLDAAPGKANRWLARRCRRVVSAVALPGMPGFAEQVTGMPIRREALCRDEPGACREQLGLDAGRPTLAVIGGSQGASSLNAFLQSLVATRPQTLAGWQVVHLCGGAEARAGLQHAYDAAGVPAAVSSFSDRMDLVWGAADLAVSRAGASSVAEAAANAVPTLFMPYPFHRDRHQWGNAEPLVRDGAAAIADDLVDAEANLREVGPKLAALLEDGPRRTAMREALIARERPDAAAEIARIVLATP